MIPEDWGCGNDRLNLKNIGDETTFNKWSGNSISYPDETRWQHLG
ncbi:hypothetical protein Rhal01_00057 [Rubritalea halochordaticola]|uniref:Uncharacterized protein n=1 Tax=Rubritalea halochordaticola TaxID=714537 RepID=A0ABP9UU20_9BACT